MTERTPPTLQRFLDRLGRRSVLSSREQQAILELPTTARELRTNQDFVRQGELTASACFVLDGLVARFEQSARGERQITALHIPGDMPDLHSVVQPKAPAAMQALTRTTILRVPHPAIRSLAARFPAIAEALWRDCMADTSIMAQWLLNVGRRDARMRVGHLLCEMAHRYEVDRTTGPVVLRLPMTQAQLADAAGLTAVHVNRTVKALRQLGVAMRSGTIYIEDLGALEQAVDFDPAYLQMNLPPQRVIVPLAA